MKKKLLALLLAVMTVATIVPTMLLPTAAIDYYNGYETAMVSSGAISVDGSAIPDAAYLNSEKIVSTLHYDNRNSSGETSSFYGYTAADEMGLYLWVKITDQSLDKGNGYEETIFDDETGEEIIETKYLDARQGDRLELYIRASGARSSASRAVGMFDFDYLDQKYCANPKYPSNYVNVNGEKVGFNVNLIDLNTTVLEDESAWVAEMYLPWEALGGDFVNFTIDDFTGFQIGFMAYNGTTAEGTNHKAYSYDTKHGGSYYLGVSGNHSFSANNSYQGSHCVPLSFAGFDTAVVADAPEVDGKLDLAYLKSEKIEAYIGNGGVQNFTAYTAATTEGYYVYADIIDDTLDKAPATTIDTGDKIQVYFQMGNRFSNRDWGYVEIDYRTEGEYTGEGNAVPFRFVSKGAFADNTTLTADDFLYATTKKADGSGWTAELFIPWTGRMVENNFDEHMGSTMAIALQVNNYTNDSNQITYCLSDVWAGSAWYAPNGSSGGPSGSFYLAPVRFIFDEDSPREIIRWAKYSDNDLVLDGEMDEAYTELAGEAIDFTYIHSENAVEGYTKGWSEYSHSKAYYAFTDTDLYVLVDVEDDTVAPAEKYSQEFVSIFFENSESIAKFALSPVGGGKFITNTTYQGVTVPLPASNFAYEENDMIALNIKGTADAYTGYTVEFKLPLTEKERADLEAGRAVNIGIGLHVNNTIEDGTRISYSFNVPYGNLWWQNGADMLGGTSMPKVRLDKGITGESDHIHKWDDGKITVAPTHLTEGIITYTCECGATKTGVVDKLPDHEWGDGVITTAPTYTTEGVKTYTCPCGATKTEKIPPIGESPKVVITSTEALVGETFKLTVSIENNPGIWGLAFELPIDTDVFEYVGDDASGTIFGELGVCGYDPYTSAYRFNGFNSSLSSNITADGKVVEIILKVKDDAPVGEYDVIPAVIAKDTIDSNYNRISFAAVGGTVTVIDYVLGDVNGDGDVTNSDVLLILRYIFSAEMYPLEEVVADVDRDGEISNADVLRIFRYIYDPELYPIG